MRYKIYTAPFDRQYTYDTEFLGAAMLRDEKKLSAFIHKFSDDPFISFFSRLGIATGDNASGVSVSNEVVGESILRWRVVDSTVVHPKIVDASRLPSVIRQGEDFVVGLDQNWVDTQGIFFAEDMRTSFFVQKRGTGGTAPFYYTMQFISGIKGQPCLRKDLLAQGRTLSYVTNAREEMSSRSQPIKFSSSGYDMYNVTQTIRHEVTASGHGLSTMIKMEGFSDNADGIVDPNHRSYFPFNPGKMLSFHLGSVAMTCVHSRTNFDPIARRVYNVNPDSSRPEVPITAGALEQFEWTEFQEEYNPYNTIATLASQIDGLIRSRVEYYRDLNTKFVIVTGNGGNALLNKIKEYRQMSKITFMQNPGNSVSRVGINYSGAAYQVDDTEFSVINYSYSAKTRGMVSEKVMWNGTMYDKDSFDFYIFPVRVNNDGRRTIRLAAKGANGVSRGLVLGSLAGMSGLYNGGNLDLSSIAGKDFANIVSQMNAKSAYQISNPVDGEKYLALSEIGVIVENPDDVLWVKPKW